jgi:hypothetical protein
MNTDSPGHLPEPGWLTLTEAASRSGHSREALRQRIRRGRLPSTKDNQGQLRIRPEDLADLPPPDASTDDQVQQESEAEGVALDVLRTTVDDLRTTVNKLEQDLERARLSADKAAVDRLADHGRAERAEAQATAEKGRAERAEARATAAEAALVEARTPLVLRLVRALRPQTNTKGNP